MALIQMRLYKLVYLILMEKLVISRVIGLERKIDLSELESGILYSQF